MLCTAGQTGCLPWLAVVCMYHMRRSCCLAYGRHHVVVCAVVCVQRRGTDTAHIYIIYSQDTVIDNIIAIVYECEMCAV